MKKNGVSFYFVEMTVTWLVDCPMCDAGTQIHLIRELGEDYWMTYQPYNGRFWRIIEERVEDPNECRIDEILDDLTDEFEENFPEEIKKYKEKHKRIYNKKKEDK